MHTVTKKNIDLIVTTLYPQAMFGYVRSNTHLEVWEVQRFCATRSFVEKLPVVGWLMASAIHWADLGTGLVWAAAPAARRRRQQMQLRWSWTPEGNSKIFKELHLFRRSPYSDHVLTEEIRSGYTFVTWITISHGSKHTYLIIYVSIYQCIQRVHIQRIYVYLVLSLQFLHSYICANPRSWRSCPPLGNRNLPVHLRGHPGERIVDPKKPPSFSVKFRRKLKVPSKN